MSKPRPFISSLWGIAFVLLLAVIILGVNNYRGNRAGFNLPFRTAVVSPVNKTQADTFQLIDSAETFAKLCQPAQPISIDWTKQLALAYFSSAQPTGGYQIKPLSVHRENTTVNVDYQLVAPPADTTVTQAVSYPSVVILLDRARLISSSNLLINLIQNKVIIHSLTLNPSQI